MSDQERKYESVRYVFSNDELRELGGKLAAEVQTLLDLKAQKSASLADYTARLKAAEAVAKDLTMKIANRSEDREVEVLEILSTPRAGWKRIVRVDNNETLREAPMTLAEMQETFGFEDRPDERPEPSGE